MGGKRLYSPVFVDEIATREVGLVDPYGMIMGVCANWAVGDWDSPQFSPTEEAQFVGIYGEDHPLRQFKFYGTEDRDAFAVAKKAFVDTLPLPHRFTTRISAPVGAQVRLRFHVGNWGLPEAQRWEAYWLDESFAMTRTTEPLVAAPLGTTPAPAPLSTVAPELLVGNPDLKLLPGAVPSDEGMVRPPCARSRKSSSPAARSASWSARKSPVSPIHDEGSLGNFAGDPSFMSG